MEVAALVILCAILNLIVDRSLAQSPVPVSFWLVLAAGDVAATYPPFLLLAWALFRIWRGSRLRHAHRSALVATLLLDVVGKLLLVYSIGSGLSNA